MTNALAKAHTKWGHVRVVEGGTEHKPAGQACEDCPLKDDVCVPTEDYEGASIAIVGEAPGYTEISEGRPFVGASGKLLAKLAQSIGLGRSDILWTNAVLCDAGTDGKKLHKAAKQCRGRLSQELAKANHVITVGAYALQSVLGLKRKPKVLEYRGFVIPHGNQLVLPTIHPAFVLRSSLWEDLIYADFERIKQVMDRGWIAPEYLQGRKRILVKTIEALERELGSLDEVVSLDVETTEEPAMVNKLVCFGLTSLSGKKTVVVPWSIGMDGSGRYFGKDQSRAAEIVTKALSIRVAVTHNGPAFDHVVLARHGIQVGEWEDTLLAHHTFASHMPQRLSHVVSMYLDAPPWKNQREESLSDLYRYNSQDCLYTVLAWKGMQKNLEPERSVYEMDRVSAELCRDMQMTGMRFDQKHSRKIARELQWAMAKAQRKARKAVGFDLPLRGKGSVKELHRAFFEVLGAPVFFRSEKTGRACLNVDALRAYATYHDPRLRDLANSVLDHRKSHKVLSTYVNPIVVDDESRVHPVWKCFGTVSGRWACSSPNLMNLPRPPTDPARRLGGIRSLYVASPGHVLVSFDFCQLEVRIAAYVSGDENMIGACESEDLHAANAALLFGEDFEKAEGQERKNLRTIAKTSTFALIYMAAPPTVFAWIVAQGIPMTLQGAEALSKKLRKAFPNYFEFQDELLHQTMRLGYVETPLSHRKRIVGYTPKPSLLANLPIQGGAADLINIRLPEAEAALSPEDKLIIQCHDQGIFDVPEKRADEVATVIKEIAEAPVEVNGRQVVFPVDVKIGGKWSEV